ncbi:hypothetical protein EJ08DRAFT_52265 [Tothia fuscella]|uniref:Uncharacterized protein n=1 Tax=Tothia fuscella TaxID=1048955 RepID=A0A9P4TT54_9PEZI|nr:hypothetical protein EJ08DRAFT_52265 [Tothia fuscella]
MDDHPNYSSRQQQSLSAATKIPTTLKRKRSLSGRAEEALQALRPKSKKQKEAQKNQLETPPFTPVDGVFPDQALHGNLNSAGSFENEPQVLADSGFHAVVGAFPKDGADSDGGATMTSDAAGASAIPQSSSFNAPEHESVHDVELTHGAIPLINQIKVNHSYRLSNPRSEIIVLHVKPAALLAIATSQMTMASTRQLQAPPKPKATAMEKSLVFEPARPRRTGRVRRRNMNFKESRIVVLKVRVKEDLFPRFIDKPFLKEDSIISLSSAVSVSSPVSSLVRTSHRRSGTSEFEDEESENEEGEGDNVSSDSDVVGSSCAGKQTKSGSTDKNVQPLIHKSINNLSFQKLLRQVEDHPPTIRELTIDIRISDCIYFSNQPKEGWRSTAPQKLIQMYRLSRLLQLDQLEVVKYRYAGDFIGWRWQFLDECLKGVEEWLKKERGGRCSMKHDGFVALRDAEWNLNKDNEPNAMRKVMELWQTRVMM